KIRQEESRQSRAICFLMTSQICRQHAGDYEGDTKNHAVFGIPKPVDGPLGIPPARVIRFAQAHEKIANQDPPNGLARVRAWRSLRKTPRRASRAPREGLSERVPGAAPHVCVEGL